MKDVKNDEVMFKRIAILDGLTRENIQAAIKQHDECTELGQPDPGVPVTVKAKPALLSTIKRNTADTWQTTAQIHAARESAETPEAFELEGRIKFLLAPYKGCEGISQWYQFVGHYYPESTREKKGSIEVAYRLVEAEIG